MQSHFHWQKFFGAATDTQVENMEIFMECAIQSLVYCDKGHQVYWFQKVKKNIVQCTPTISLTTQCHRHSSLLNNQFIKKLLLPLIKSVRLFAIFNLVNMKPVSTFWFLRNTIDHLVIINSIRYRFITLQEQRHN